MQHESIAPPRPADPADAQRLRAQLWLRLAYGLVAALALALLLVNLGSYPQPWFDDGYVMAVAKMLATQSVYGLPDSGGPWVLDPSITSGPPLLLPLALVFKLAGVSILAARLLLAGAALLTLVAYAVLARRLVGPAAAAGALLLVLVGSNEIGGAFVQLGRQALGEIPALGMWIAGVLLWLRGHDEGRERSRWPLVVGAGLCFGLAVVTKPQMVMGVAPGLALVCLADRLYYRRASWAAFVVPAVLMVGCVAAWYLVQMLLLTPEVFFAKSAVLRSGVASNILAIDLQHIRNALGVIWRSGFLLWGLPGLLYGARLARERSAAGLAHGWVLALVLVWLLWFAAFSIGWARYAFAPFILTPIWTARLVFDLFERTGRPARAAIAAAALALLLFNGRTLAAGIFGPQERSAEQFSEYLRTTLPADTVVASWEWNLDITAPQRFAHPPPLVMYEVIDLMQGGQTPPLGLYDPSPAAPAYVVDGPFSNWTGIYRAFIEARCEPVATVGTYTLYRVVR
ncbi:MAG TPA: glycosyltransferase family 39 protein [Roseiflexaceae bacterium]|nr:glycosyltransferase family 39 protein [Roseiflexaceae bacterium]